MPCSSSEATEPGPPAELASEVASEPEELQRQIEVMEATSTSELMRSGMKRAQAAA